MAWFEKDEAVNTVKTAEDYRKAAEAHKEAEKNMRTTFLKTGIFFVLALVVIIILAIAWFVSNNRVSGEGTSIGANSSEIYLIASTGTRQTAERDKYKENGENILSDTEASEYTSYYDTLTGETVALQDDQKLELYNGSAWHLQDNGTMKPGARGVLEFYVIPQIQGLSELTFNLNTAGYKETENASNPVSLVEDPVFNALLEGHILFFTNLDDANGYSGLLGPGEKEIRVKAKSGELQKDIPYKVSIYWIWPRRYHNFIYHQRTTYGDLFGTESEDYTALLSFINSNRNNFFYNNNKEIKAIVTQKDMSDEDYALGTSYYNMADEYIGTHVDYIYLEIK